jgi:alpha-tubulin suppressor-like RCC1 family protein
LEPKLVDSVVEDGCFTKQVEVGETHTAVLTTEGEILCTGAGSYGRLGNFETVDQLFLEPVELLVSGVNQIAAGKSFTLALKDGLVHGWGRNHKGQVRGEKLFLCGIDAFDHIVSCSKTCRFV